MGLARRVLAVGVLAVAVLEVQVPSVGSPAVEFWPAHATDSSAKRPCQFGPKARNWSRRPSGRRGRQSWCAARRRRHCRPPAPWAPVNVPESVCTRVVSNGHVKPVRGQGGRGDVSPLDNGRRAVLQELGESEVDDLLEVFKAPDISVQELPAGRRFVTVDQHERGAGDGLAHAQCGSQALREGGLAGAEFTAQKNRVPRAQKAGQHGADALRIVWGSGADDDRYPWGRARP